jgi:hypothetical protein
LVRTTYDVQPSIDWFDDVRLDPSLLKIRKKKTNNNKHDRNPIKIAMRLFLYLFLCVSLPSADCQTPVDDDESDILFNKATAIFKNRMEEAWEEAASLLRANGLHGDTLIESLFDSREEAMAQLKIIPDDHSFYFMDRHIRKVQALVHGHDCKSREFDLDDPSFDIDQARQILEKCRFLIIRNVHDPETIHQFKVKHTQYLKTMQQSNLDDLHQRVLYNENNPRYEVLVPQDQYRKENCRASYNPEAIKTSTYFGRCYLCPQLWNQRYRTRFVPPGLARRRRLSLPLPPQFSASWSSGS